jgi:hypothetical protein
VPKDVGKILAKDFKKFDTGRVAMLDEKTVHGNQGKRHSTAIYTSSAAVGRTREVANRAFLDSQHNLGEGLSRFNALMSQVVGGKHDKPRRVYTPTHKRRAYKILREP